MQTGCGMNEAHIKIFKVCNTFWQAMVPKHYDLQACLRYFVRHSD